MIVSTSLIALAVGVAIGVIAANALRKRRSGAGGSDTMPAATSAVSSMATPPSEFDGAFVRLVRALPLGVVFVDPAARITFANAAASRIFGFDLARATGTHVIASIPNVELEGRIGDALRGETSIEPLTVTSNAEQRTHRISIYSIRAPEEEAVEGVVLFAEDQTDVLRLERARKEFLSNVSHELRTPLASIKLMLETVIQSPDEETSDIFLPQALAQVDRLAALAQQLLDQARADSSQVQLHLQEIDLEAVARPIVATFAPEAFNKGVALDLRAARPVRIEADPDRLAQVFVNLIDNALRHTPEGGGISVESDAEGGDAVVRVRDTGVGIPYRDLPHIFERFYVVDRSRTRMSGGAGLGLAIVKSIIDAHGGTIRAESMLGSGTTFTIRIPMFHLSTMESS